MVLETTKDCLNFTWKQPTVTCNNIYTVGISYLDLNKLKQCNTRSIDQAIVNAIESNI